MFRLISDCDDSGRKKYKRVYGVAYDEVWQSLRSTGFWSLESGGRFSVGAFVGNVVSVAVKVF
jgi:hypothetical protein